MLLWTIQSEYQHGRKKVENSLFMGSDLINNQHRAIWEGKLQVFPRDSWVAGKEESTVCKVYR